MVLINPVTTAQELKAFVDFPHTLFKNDPNYVPELFIAQRDLLTPGKHPFHNHSEIKLFVARSGGKIVGRIAGILNNNHNKFNNSQDGCFGFFDVVDDYEIAKGLLDTAGKWLKEKGCKRIIGPLNFSTNETCGLLVEGYNSPPVAMMAYNPPYYVFLLEKYGFVKNVDLWAYKIEAHDFKDKAVKLLDVVEERLRNKGIVIRKANLKNFYKEIEALKEVYNAAWDKNLGFVPMTDEEFKYQAKDLKLILDPDFCLVAEHEGRIIGFALCIPDINEILIKIERGRLFPFGLIKLLTQRKKIKKIRIIALGVLEEYRKLGIEGCFYGRIIKSGLAKGIKTAEASWVLENNVMMNQAIKNINGKLYKKYRIYEKAA